MSHRETLTLEGHHLPIPLVVRRCSSYVAAACVLIGWTGFLLPARGADWNQFRGPNGQGQSSAVGLPFRWTGVENVAWKTSLPGTGWSSPVLERGLIWLTTAEQDGKSLRALAVDFETGRLIHNVEVFRPAKPVPKNTKNSHASPTAVVADGRVFVHYGAMGTAGLSAADGRILWKNETLVIQHKEGPGSSPIVWKDLLIVHCDGTDQQYVAALDVKTGEIRWKGKRSAPFRDHPDLRKAYSTPILISVRGADQLVCAGADQVNVFDPATGRELWRVRYQGFSNVPVPLFDGRRIYLCTGYFVPQLWAIRVDGRGDVTDTHVDWKFTRGVPANSSPVLAGDQILFVSDGGIVTRLDCARGKQNWQRRLGGNYSASPIVADGKIFLSNEEGKTTVYEIPAGKQSDLLLKSTNKLPGRIMASPAAIDQSLLIRTESHLYRIQSGRNLAADHPSKTPQSGQSSNPSAAKAN